MNLTHFALLCYLQSSFYSQSSLLFAFFQPEEDIGDIFQDQGNMAAILMRKHLQSGDLLMVSC